MSKQGLTIFQQQQLKALPQQIQTMQIFGLNAIELEDRVRQEVEDNPALEVADDADGYVGEGGNDLNGAEERDGEEEMSADYGEREEFDYGEYVSDEYADDYLMAERRSEGEGRTLSYADGESPLETLTEQVGLMGFITEEAKKRVMYVIENLDSAGFLTRSVEEMADDYSFQTNILTSEKEMAEAVRTVQGLDPAGVGARDLKECLILQLRRKSESEDARLAERAVSECFDEIANGARERVQRMLKISAEEMRRVMSELAKLSPRPFSGSDAVADHAVHITPEYYVHCDGETVVAGLVDDNVPTLTINRGFAEMMEKGKGGNGKSSKAEKAAAMFAKQKVDAARWFIDAVRQRKAMMEMVIKAVAEIQRRYFLSGDEDDLRRMTLKDLAEATGTNLSMMSRLTSGHYVQTDYGVKAMRFFFSEGFVTDDEETVSRGNINRVIKEAIEAEDAANPVTDEMLVRMLKEKGMTVARRTVSKYREAMGIGSARARMQRAKLLE